MSSQNTMKEESESCAKQTILLDIPPRLQWDNDNGYCGEASLQSIGLYYGAWISQKLVHDINKGEYLLQPLSTEDHRDPLRTLTLLHFKYDEWDWKDSPQPQFRNFCHWMKRSIIHRHPVIFGIFLPDNEYLDYDHIVPAVGIRYTNENEYDPDDELIYHSLYEKNKFEKRMSEHEFGATRQSIDTRDDDDDDGCIPLDVAYGIAVTGIIDEDQVTLPVRLSVPYWNEPNPRFGHKPRVMTGTVTVSNLTVGNSYILLRYSSYTDVPTRGDANTFLQSNFHAEHRFPATETTYEYVDPEIILSAESVYYRCVEVIE